MTLAYLEETARQAGIRTKAIAIGDIGWNARAGQFRDLEEEVIGNVFALYPWEWLLGEYPDALLRVQGEAIWMEPIWKMLWSNKALLAILWELFPRHPNLSRRASTDRAACGNSFASRFFRGKARMLAEKQTRRVLHRRGIWQRRICLAGRCTYTAV